MSGALTIVDLRDGGVDDLPEVAGIMQAAFDPRYGEAWTSAQCMGMLSLPGVWLTVASVDGGGAGFALSRTMADEAELLLLATCPAQRRRGVAGALLRAAMADARRRGAGRMHLEVRANNEAVHLYRREGFARIGERPGYYRGRNGQSFDAHTYSREI